MPSRFQRRYDPHLRDHVRTHRDLRVAKELGVPRSTAATWLKTTPAPIHALDERREVAELQAELVLLRRRIRAFRFALMLLLVVLRTFSPMLDRKQISDDRAKRRILRAVDRARTSFTLRRVLRLIGFSESRYHAWKRERLPCELEEVEECPTRSPQQLTPQEVRSIHEMVLSEDYRHVPTRSLAILAQRIGRVFASPTSWYRLIRSRGWKRPRRRVHPTAPREGLRASRPNETWHIDTTVIRLLDGTKVYLHAVLDNFSRRILAWRVAAKLEVASTIAILAEACARLEGREVPSVLADSGVENVNAGVDALISQGLFHRVLAQVEIVFSNSMIEAWWRSLKHQWLFLHELTHLEQVEKLVTFYVEQHNTVVPHSAFRGQTPDEMYFGSAAGVFDRLEAQRAESRRKRLEVNRALSCAACAASG